MKLQAILYMLLLTMLTAGCSDEQREQQTAELSIDVQVERTNTRAGAIFGNAFWHGSTIQVVLVGSDAGATLSAQEPYTYISTNGTTGMWIPVKNALELDVNPYYVFAHYPAKLPTLSSFDPVKKQLKVELPAMIDFGPRDDYNSDYAFWFNIDGGLYEKEILMAEGEVDYMTGKGKNTVARDQKATSIAMQHALPMIIVRSQKSPENSNPGILKSVSFQNMAADGPLKKGAFNLNDNSFESGEVTSYTRKMDGYPDGTYFALMVYPATIAAGEVQLVLGVDQASYPLNIGARKWESGKIYVYNVTLRATEAELTEFVNVLDWPDLNPNNDHNFPLD